MLKSKKTYLVKPKINQIWFNLELSILFKIEKIVSVNSNYDIAMEFFNYPSSDIILFLCCKKENNFVYLKENMFIFSKKYLFYKNKGDL